MLSDLRSEMKNLPIDVKALLVSGYPRSLKDATLYLETVGRADGVILLNWTQSRLERQIEYGAGLGHIDLDTAKVELENFGKQTVPVAEFFDYKQLLYVVRSNLPVRHYLDLD